MTRQQANFKGVGYLLLLILIIILLHAQQAIGQNIGIGTNAPLSKLHVFNGASGNTTPFAPLVIESNTNTYINLLSPNGNETSILFGKTDNAASGGIIYNNTSNLNGFQFRTNGNQTHMVLTNTGDLGLGITSPSATLDVRRGANTGGTAYFWGTNNITHINFGSNEDTYIRAGKNNSSVIINDISGGKVGIRTMPATNFDILGANNWDLNATEGDVRIGNSTYRLKFGVALDGGGAGAAGIMQNGGLGLLSLGSQGNYQLQINGGDNSVNLSNAALKINGNPGTTGQLLQSTGSSSPQWQPLGSILQTYYRTGGTAFITATYPTANFFSYNFSLSTTSRLIISGLFNSSQSYNCSFGCSDGITQIDIIVDNNPVNLNVYMSAGGNSKSSASINNYFYDLPAGNHEIHFLVKYFTGSFLDVNGIYSSILVVPLQ